MSSKIIYIDDNTDHLKTVQELFEEKGLEVDTFTSPIEAIKHIEKNPYKYKMAITDYDMRSMKGDQLTLRIKVINSKIHVVVISGHEKVGKRCLESGANQFIPKFQKNSKGSHLENLLILSEIAIAQLNANKGNFDKNKKDISETLNIAGQSDELAKVANIVKLFANTLETVSISGESGVGKERVAKAIHEHSAHATGPFIAINCGALSENLLESELFGHEKGAFTGADKTKSGKFVAAHNGTIFLDEIGEMPLSAQVKLLRVLQESEVTAVGSNKAMKINVRIVTATHKDLQQEVSNGNFREDLFYRINVLPIHIPPLRDRKADIGPISHYIMKKINSPQNPRCLTAKAISKLKLGSWPGNVRDLEIVLKRSNALTTTKYIHETDIVIEEFTSKVGLTSENEFLNEIDEFLASGSFPKYRDYMEKIEKKLLKQALVASKGNRKKASKLLQMPYTTYNSKFLTLAIGEVTI